MKKKAYIIPATDVVALHSTDALLQAVSGNSNTGFGDAEDGKENEEADVKGSWDIW